MRIAVSGWETGLRLAAACHAVTSNDINATTYHKPSFDVPSKTRGAFPIPARAQAATITGPSWERATSTNA